ncbi:MAG: CDP-alcohol phosphatidyltransferase family protein [Micrococcales bacterium]|nr:CDP-alcohol phosphatidyltransferase family protein [Micrococcales bacterium]
MLNQTNARAALAKVVEPVARGLLRIGLSPDAVTVIGTVGVSGSALYFFPRGDFVPGILVMVLFVFSDMLDGTMARLQERTGVWGAFLDSSLDRVADGFIFCSVLIWAVRTESIWVQAAALVCLVGGFLISYARARAESVGLDCAVGIAERTERMLIVLIPAFLYGLGIPYILPAALFVLAVLVMITVWQRFAHVYRQAMA